MTKQLLRASIKLFLLVSLSAHAEQPSRVVLSTDSGPIRGEFIDGVHRFLGIPYAAPPVGELRWRPPQDAPRWQNIREASTFGPACTAPESFVGEADTASGDGWDLIMARTRDDTSEDCLTLNIWTSSLTSRVPVMVFMASVGEGSLPYWDGTAFARDGVVLVTFNQRMWTMDSFAHPALEYSKLGKLDQLKVLSWIRDNITEFGGDPNNVTIFGQSAGGRYVLQLMMTPGAEGLFHKAIVQSCCSWAPVVTPADAEKIAVELVNYAGLDGSHITADELRQLDAGTLPVFVGGLRVDLVSEVQAGQLLDVPLLIGGTDWDGSSLRKATPEEFLDGVPEAVLEAYREDEVRLSKSELGYQVYTDEHVNAPVRWFAREISRRNESPVYRYLFSYVLSLRANQQGAAHTDDVPFIFDSWSKIFNFLGVDPPMTHNDRKATALMHACWISFARNGVPSCGDSGDWPESTPETDVLVDLTTEVAVRHSFRKKQYDAVQAWSMEFLPKRIDVSEVINALREGTR